MTQGNQGTGLTDEIKTKMRVFALHNAVGFGGKCSPGPIVGKTMTEHPEAKGSAADVGRFAAELCKEINAMSLEGQQAELETSGKGVIKEKEHKAHSIFDSLRISHEEWDGKMVTAFPPEPSKYPHIGHAKAILLNHNLAKEYGGKFILRFEDTNPDLAKEEFYDIHLENYKWLGISWDEVVYVSDHMEKFDEMARKLIAEGHAYACVCPVEKVREGRKNGAPCDCRDGSSEDVLALYEKMKTATEGEIILRLKIDLKHKNSAMRDPTMMRIIDKPHPRTGTKYRIWPTYDLENAVMDGFNGVTHRLRSKEFELRNELQRHIQRILGFAETNVFEFGRFNMEGVESSGRIIRELIEKGEFTGWDDPRLTTLVALRRRGFQPEAIASFVLATGVTKAEAVMTWDDLIVQNKRLLDRQVARYFFIKDPVQVTITNAPDADVELRKHPEHDDFGVRRLHTAQEFYLSKQDIDAITEGDLVRLMGHLNFRREKAGYAFDSMDYEKFKNVGAKNIHWLPYGDQVREVDVLMPDQTVMSGLAEAGIDDIEPGEVIQFERMGFCRLDQIGGGRAIFWFTHK
ncbi:MAG: glutamate--tRNA ligase [archaeon]